MKTPSGLFLKVLLNRTSDGTAAPVNLRAIPEEDLEAVIACPVTSNDLSPLLEHKSRTLAKWHYSWIHKLLQPFSLEERSAVMALFSEQQQQEVIKLFNQPHHPPKLTPIALKFYKYYFYPKLNWDSVLPYEYLPESSYNHLLHLKKTELVKVMDFLGLYDLAHEMKRIVANKTLKELYACLNKEQQLFLRQCMHAKDNVMTPNLHLENWSGDKKALMQLLHRRGISRMALALSGQHPDLIWHLAHILDIGRGQLLQKTAQKTKVPALSDAVGLQLENVLNTLFKRTNP